MKLADTPADGMTLREYYAGLAMQGLIASASGSDVTDDHMADFDFNTMGRQAVQCAQALISALEGTANATEKS